MREITPINNNGSILLRFSYRGERYSLNTGGKYNNKLDLSRANEIANKIYQDCLTNNFDTTLTKYVSLKRSANKALAELKESKLIIEINNVILLNLFNEYTLFKGKTLKINSLRDYKLIENKLNKCPYKLVKESIDIINWLVNDHKGISTTTLVKQWKLINACCKWAVLNKKITTNTFEKLNRLIPTTKTSNNNDDINPFTYSEMEEIIKAFKNNRYYNFYAPLVEFLFITGCRPNEALALQWKSIKNNTITFSQVLTHNNKIEQGTKTENRRTISINDRLLHLFDTLFSSRHLEFDYVFISKTGKLIDWHNFANRAWRNVLDSLPHIEYRNPYQMRHTAITMMIRAGIDSIIVARWVGNSPSIIASKYLGNVSDIKLPDIYND